MIEILNKEDCNGCCACMDVCASNAIQMKTDEEGFWYPEVDSIKCSACNLCSEVCPELHALELKKNDFDKPLAYAAVHKNIEVRFNSTSGGLFSALAEKMYREGGYVGGAVYCDDFSVKHLITNRKEDLERLRGSKYLQSNLSGWFREIKSLLAKGEKVLVCGTPCQMAGLRRFVAKNTANLLIVDFVCRGINSPWVFRKYLDSIENVAGKKIVAVKAKNKELGWRNLTFKATFVDGKEAYHTRLNDYYTRGYLVANAYCRPSCYQCRFKGFPRIADITLADFWGIENVDTELDHDLGTSMVLLNSQKGVVFFDGIKEKVACRTVNLDVAVAGNSALLRSVPDATIDRKKFFNDLSTTSFAEVAEKYFPFPAPTLKMKLRSLAGSLLTIGQETRLYPGALFQFVRYNFLSHAVTADWKKRRCLLPAPHCVIEIGREASLRFGGILHFGVRTLKHSKLESRLSVANGGALEVDGDFILGYGSDVEIFKGGCLVLHGGGGSNINTTIICAEKIEIGKNVMIGRNVLIRDYNGDHYIARQGYKTSRPVIIGNHVWLCEGCIIMPGVKIGDGAIVGAGAFVASNVPPHSLVMGNPARIIDTDVFWKA